MPVVKGRASGDVYIVEYLNAVCPGYGYFESPEEVAEFALEYMFPDREDLAGRVRAYPLTRNPGPDAYVWGKPEGFDHRYDNGR